jgi:nicotinate-nucleotide pyrophosphorylase (carboxylating)
VEVRSVAELQEALEERVDQILLDNMTAETMKQAVELTAGKVPLEASGNVTLENVRQVAETGVDFISVGSLTHSVKALDLSFIVEHQKV